MFHSPQGEDTPSTGRMSRAQFLRGRFGARSAPVRPPWSLDETAFLDQCTRCDECISACPERIIVRGSGGFPEINLTDRACTFCGECTQRCEPGALSRAAMDRGAPPWSLKAAFTPACLNRSGVFCRTCGDHCRTGAIRFRPQMGGAFLPELDAPRCTGCGACGAACPARAIAVGPPAARAPGLSPPV
jgi:ferredoxin-type protein NapF